MARLFPEAPPASPGSLAEALATIPEPRKPYGWRPEYPPVPLVVLLQCCVAAILCGACGPTGIAQWVKERLEDRPALLQQLGLPAGRRLCAATVHRVFKAVDADAFERAVGGWLARTGGAPQDPLALDGKTLRGAHGAAGGHLVAAYAHQAEVVIAQLCTEGKGQELAAAKQVLAGLPLAGRVVTADALLTQRELCQQVVGQGGDYFLPVKDNQPALEADIVGAFSPAARPHAESDRRRPPCGRRRPADLAAAPVGGAGRPSHDRRGRPGQSPARAV